MSEHDDEIDFYDEQEGAEWCDRCQGLGTADCHCGGDQCYCENAGEMECPQCDGEGRWTPTPAQLAARAETARWWRELCEKQRTAQPLSPIPSTGDDEDG